MQINIIGQSRRFIDEIFPVRYRWNWGVFYFALKLI